MKNIETIIFDLGGVILDIDYNLTRIAFEKLGVAHFDQMYSQNTANQLFQQLEKGKISEENFYEELNSCTRLHLSPLEINGAWNAMLLSFREKSLEYLDEIKNKYRLFLLSNTNFIHMAAFKAMFHELKREKSFEEYFDKAFYSCEIGFRKPDAVCYECVLNEIETAPGKTLFIDDSADNIEAARKAGIQTILLAKGKNIEELGL